VRLTILGGGGVWPSPQQACSGYLLEHEGATLLIDPGYAVLPQLLGLQAATAVDAVLVSHGHLDHCADLPALLMARATAGGCDPLPVYAPRGALTDLLRAGRSRSLSRSVELTEVGDGDVCELGPFRIEAALLPHHITNVGFRISASGHVVAYTGDSGDAAERVTLAKAADVLVVEATYNDDVPRHQARFLSSAAQAARLSLAAQVDHTLLTHHLPGRPVAPWLAAARAEGLGSVLAAAAGMSVDLGPDRVPWARRASGLTAATRQVPVLPRRARVDRLTADGSSDRRRADAAVRGLTRQ
jgi:ribonuclease BN (tRNA processing enzyme)